MKQPRARQAQGFRLLFATCLSCCLCLGLQGCTASGTASASGSINSGDDEQGGEWDDSGSSPGSGSGSSEKRRFSCPAGACSECGPGVCPPGMFCLQTAEGEPGCSFLPQCDANDACSCVERSMGPGCTCSQQQRAVSVSCN